MSRRLDRKKRTLLTEIEAVLADGYRTLSVVSTDPAIVVRGGFPVRIEGQIVDRFLVEIVFPRSYPRDIPLVYELSGRIPRIDDNHVSGDGTLCVLLLDERWRYWRRGKGVREFFGDCVNDYFLSRVYREQNSVYPFGERAHDVLGIREYYAEELGTDDWKVIVRCLDYLSRKRVSGWSACYCGSRRPLRKCHMPKLVELRDKIPRQTARTSLERILAAAQLYADLKKLFN